MQHAEEKQVHFLSEVLWLSDYFADDTGDFMMLRASNVFSLRVCSLTKRSVYPHVSALVTRCSSTNAPQPPKGKADETPHIPVSLTDVHPEQSYLDDILLKKSPGPSSATEKVKKGVVNTALYLIVGGSILVLGTLAYYFVEQFFAPDSPQIVYTTALNRVLDDEECKVLLGDGIKAFGQDIGRGRRRHIVNRRYYAPSGEERLRVLFNVKGTRRSGKVLAEIAKIGGQWEYRLIQLTTDETIPSVVTIIDHDH